MSLRYEQYYSLLKTRQLLRDMVVKKTRPKTVKELHQRVFSCLRHFPPLMDDGRPMFSQDGFTTPSEQENT
jgi:hypothetical protein